MNQLSPRMSAIPAVEIGLAPAEPFGSKERARWRIDLGPGFGVKLIQARSIGREVRLVRHLRRSVSIRAALDRVYALAEDRKRWQDWYVGFSHEEKIPDQELVGSFRHFQWLSVGTPFPLTQRVLEDRVDPSGAHWRIRSKGGGTCADAGQHCALLMLASDQNWAYSPSNGDTEVEVDLDYELPVEVPNHPALRQRIERLEAECLEQSLENLKRLCEAA